MSTKINPAWQAWQALQNEGGEGYNPHPKWIAATPAPVKAAAKVDNRMLHDESGNLIPAAKLAVKLARDIERLPRLTDATAIAITEAAIAHAKAQLGG